MSWSAAWYSITPVGSLSPSDDFGQPVAMTGFDLSFDGDRSVFCMKPEEEKPDQFVGGSSR